MDLASMAAQMFMSKSGAQGLDLSQVLSGLRQILPTDNKGAVDLPALVSKFNNNGNLASLASSWLGNGQNSSLSSDDVFNLFGQSNMENFSREVNMDKQQAAHGLSQMIPELIDKNSKNGALLTEESKGLGKRILEGLFG